MEVAVDYMDIHDDVHKLPVQLRSSDGALINLRVLSDSVEYTIVRN